MLAASLQADVPLFMASPTSAWASAGASFVPSPVIATRCPSACSRRMNAILSSGRRLGDEVVDAGLAGDRGRRERVVAGDHHGPDAHPAELLEALHETRLDGVLELDQAERPRPSSRTASGVAPRPAIASVSASTSARHRPVEIAGDGVDGALEHQAPVGQARPRCVRVSAREVALLGDPARQAPRSPRRRPRHQVRPSSPRRRRASVDDRAALRRLVAQRGHECRLEHLGLGDAGRRDDRRREPVAERDGAGLVEQDDVDVAGGLDRAAAHGQDVEAGDPVHARDADRREEPADRRRDEADEQGDEGHDAHRRTRRRRRTAGG